MKEMLFTIITELNKVKASDNNQMLADVRRRAHIAIDVLYDNDMLAASLDLAVDALTAMALLSDKFESVGKMMESRYQLLEEIVEKEQEQTQEQAEQEQPIRRRGCTIYN